MKINTKKIILIELLTSILLLLNALFTKYNNLYVVAIFLSLLFLLVIKLFGFERDNFRFKKDILLTMVNYALVFMIIYYLSGLYFGYLKSGYSLRFINIFKNILPYVLIICISELLRYSLNTKIANSKIGLAITVLLFTLIDMTINLHLYDIVTGRGLIEMSANVIIPSLFKNTLLSYVSLKVGYKSNIAYRAILELPIFIIPIVPDASTYLYLIASILFSWLLLMDVVKFYTHKKVVNPKDIKSYKVPIIISTIIILICIYFTCGLFHYVSMAVGSNSMQGAIHKGDVVIFEKVKPNEVKVGQVLVFKKENKKIVHRIVKIKKENDNYYISTKGDNNDFIDNWIVTNDEVLGIVKLKIRFIGYPTVWINELLK